MAKKILLVFVAIIFLTTTAHGEDLLTQPPITGTYTVVTLRHASDVANTRKPSRKADKALGQNITFTKEGGLKMKGIGCKRWEVYSSPKAVIHTGDPILADIHVPPTTSPISSGDQRIGKSFHYRCEGESVLHVYQVDERVLVIPWKNSSQYLIAEKSLSKKQIKKLQTQLRGMKFHHFAPTGILDANTLEALSAWAQYRLKNSDTYRFKRTAITENLLDALRILK